jgi:hypothetical protein
MFTELLQAEVWRKKLENSGYRVILEPWLATKEQKDKEKRNNG